jgi:hypothetical protein
MNSDEPKMKFFFGSPVPMKWIVFLQVKYYNTTSSIEQYSISEHRREPTLVAQPSSHESKHTSYT